MPLITILVLSFICAVVPVHGYLGTCEKCNSQQQCEKYCNDETIRCKTDIYSHCKWNDRTGCFLNDRKQCYCRKAEITPNPTCTNKIAQHSDICTNDYAVGPCNKAHKDASSCFHDCDGNCVYDYRNEAGELKVGECKKYCDPIQQCLQNVNPHYTVIEEHLYVNCQGNEENCNTCYPCYQQADGNGNKVWGDCKLETNCATKICVSTKIGTENDIKPVKTYCFDHEPCRCGEACTPEECKDADECVPCPLEPEEVDTSLAEGCYVDVNSGDCVSNFEIKGDDSNFRYSRKCRKTLQMDEDRSHRFILPDINDGGWWSWTEAQYYCRCRYNSDLVTIKGKEDMDKTLEIVRDHGLISTAWTGLRSKHKAGFFEFVDETKCPPEHNGRFSGVCADPSIWSNGHPIKCIEGGQMCVRLIVADGLIINDMNCDERVEAFLCNPPNSATGGWTGPYIKPIK